MEGKYSITKERFNSLFDQIRQSGLAKTVHPQESKIRIELPLKNGFGQYVFNIKDQNVDNITTFSLDRNDVFVPNNWGIMIALKNNESGVETLYTFAPKKKEGEPSIFEAGFENDDIDALFAGNLQWILDNNVVLSAYPMEKFHKVPETQGLFILNSDNEPVQEGIQLQRNLDYDLELVIPKFQICGTRDQKITVSFDAANKTFPVTEGYTPYLVLLMEGFLVKGGCEQPKDGKNPFGDAAGNW